MDGKSVLREKVYVKYQRMPYPLALENHANGAFFV